MCIFCEKNKIRKIGEYFGYPKCCIDWHIGYQEKYGTDKSHFDKNQRMFNVINDDIGFVPCPEHSKRIMEHRIKVEDIIKNRKCSIPFPYADMEIIGELEEYLENK